MISIRFRTNATIAHMSKTPINLIVMVSIFYAKCKKYNFILYILGDNIGDACDNCPHFFNLAVRRHTGGEHDELIIEQPDRDGNL